MDGRRIIDRVAESLAKVCDQVILSANHADAAYWLPGVPVMRDRYEDAGGLAGVDSALAWTTANSGSTAVLIVAWDMPFVPAALLGELCRAALASNPDAVVPESVSPYGFEPFCAWYASRVADPLARYLSAGGGAARDFLATVRTERIPMDALRRFGDPAMTLLSVNSDADLERANATRRP